MEHRFSHLFPTPPPGAPPCYPDPKGHPLSKSPIPRSHLPSFSAVPIKLFNNSHCPGFKIVAAGFFPQRAQGLSSVGS